MQQPDLRKHLHERGARRPELLRPPARGCLRKFLRRWAVWR